MQTYEKLAKSLDLHKNDEKNLIYLKFYQTFDISDLGRA